MNQNREPHCLECVNWFLGCLNGRENWKDKAVMPNRRLVTLQNGTQEFLCDAFQFHSDPYRKGRVVYDSPQNVTVKELVLYIDYWATCKDDGKCHILFKGNYVDGVAEYPPGSGVYIIEAGGLVGEPERVSGDHILQIEWLEGK